MYNTTTGTFLEPVEVNFKHRTVLEHKFRYGIRNKEDCVNASEEYMCGFADDIEQLDLFDNFDSTLNRHVA